MSALTVFLLVVAALVVLVVVAAALVGLWLGRHAVRAGRVAGRQLRAGWSTARAAVPSDARAVRLERARLERELAVTSNAWQSGRRLLDRPARRRLEANHETLTGVARRLAYELSIAAADTDAARRDAWLPDLRLRVDAFVVACGHFRQGVLLASGAYGTAMHVTSVAVGLAEAPVSLSKSLAEEPAVR